MRVISTLAVVAAGLAGSAASQPAPAGPVATYWMSAQTTSGFTMGGAGGQPSSQQMMGMMMGGGRGGAQHSYALTLQLGSQRRAPGEPQAEHAPPPNLGAGRSLPLLTPRQAAPERDETPEMPRDYQRPKGRMLIFWGCGDRARPGQPVVIEFAQMAQGKVPPAMAAMTRGLGVTPMRPPSPSRSATYGEWPNERTRTNVSADGSLIGEHVVRGNYTPEIRFNLAAEQDFLPPVKITANQKTPAGSSALEWRPVDGADAYLATLMGGGRNDTVVMWTSSEVQASAFALPEYLSGPDIARLVASRALMGPQTTTCRIPKEAVDAAEGGLVQLVAYAKDANFSYPPRPANPKTPWKPEWTVKVRYRSAAGTMLGMPDMNQMGGTDGEGGPPNRYGQPNPYGQPPPPPPRRPNAGSILKGLGGF